MCRQIKCSSLAERRNAAAGERRRTGRTETNLYGDAENGDPYENNGAE